MADATSGIPFPSFKNVLNDYGPIVTFGWFSLLIVIVMGCILLMAPPRSGRRVSVINMFAACLHIQILIFILCVPLTMVLAAYLTTSIRPYVIDMLVAAASVLLNLTVGGAFLFSISLRHKTTPAMEWPAAVSIITSILSIFGVWEFKIALCVWQYI